MAVLNTAKESILFRGVLSFLLVMVLLQANFAQNDLPSNAKKGSCYAKCLVWPIEDSLEVAKDTLFLYTGSDIDLPCIRFEKNEDIVRIVRLKPYEEFEFIPFNFYRLTDTTLVKDFARIVRYEMKYIYSDWQTSEWREVLCDTKVTAEIVRKIQNVLIQEGFLNYDSLSGQFSSSTRRALVEYQKRYGLPIGSLDLETLKRMGLK